jgi:hypothetical protein
LATGKITYFLRMTFEIIAGADTYEQEGPMTTFFHSEGRRYVDSWSSRLASFRTVDVARVRRLDVLERVAER